MVPLEALLKTDSDFNLGLDPNSIDSVLPKCRESLLSTSHSLTTSSSFCKIVSKLDKHLCATKIAESSAYFLMIQYQVKASFGLAKGIYSQRKHMSCRDGSSWPGRTSTKQRIKCLAQ